MIRPATDADAEAVTAIAQAAFEHYIPRIGLQPIPMTLDYSTTTRATGTSRPAARPWWPTAAGSSSGRGSRRVAGMTSVGEDLAPSGVLRASINLGNPVLAQGTPDEPAGVTVDIARELGRRLEVPVELVCFDAARKSFEAMTTGQADICFLAIDPARAGEVAFTAPYVVIEGVFAVPAESGLTTVAEVDAPGVRIGVKKGSAYDLFLTRELRQATVVRGDEGVDVFLAEGLEATAGIRQPIARFVAENPAVRLIDERFMEIRQAVGTTKTRSPETVAYLHDVVEELKTNGFVADSLIRSNQPDAAVAPSA